MTTEGHPLSRSRRALASGSPTIALSTAAELPHPLHLADALALCLVLRDGDAAMYPRAAGRWLARYLLETPGADLDEAELVLGLLAGLRGDYVLEAANALAGLASACDEFIAPWVGFGKLP